MAGADLLFRKAQLRKKPSGFQELATQRGANYALACSPKINLPPAETLSGPHKQNTRRINSAGVLSHDLSTSKIK